MAPIAFCSRPLPSAVAPTLRRRLSQAHRSDPFTALDPRHAARRAVAIVDDVGLEATVYRGALDLEGSEVDHVWLDLDGRVIDVAFPLLVPSFVELLRGFVVGDVDAAQLQAAAATAGIDQRVLGEFPPPLRYRGEPVWSDRR